MERRDRGSRGKPALAASAGSDGYLHVGLVGQEETNLLVKLKFSTVFPGGPARQTLRGPFLKIWTFGKRSSITKSIRSNWQLTSV